MVLLQVAPPNSRGEYGLGLGVEFLAPALQTARVVVAEVNDLVPWTYTEPLRRRQNFSLIVESSRDRCTCLRASGRWKNAIAEHVAELVPDGAVLECGIGNLPTAIMAKWRDRIRSAVNHMEEHIRSIRVL